MDGRAFIVNRKNLRDCRVAEEPAASRPLQPGELRMRIDSFALTANNITYGAFGEAMHYWDFFPERTEGFGRIPVWGFADVVESTVEVVAAGERFYGYYPMSTHVVLQAKEASVSGFVDSSPHRKDLAPVYNRYVRCSRDPGYRPEWEAQIALLRPLFITSFLIDDFLADNGFFGARSIVLSSASSKTAYGLAFCLSQREGDVRTIGLTSPANLDFTRSLGCYDEVVTYDQVEQLPADVPTAYVDMSGSAPLRRRLHTRFGDALTYSCSVGGTHWDEVGSGKDLPGPRPTLFFAPARIQKRSADWGHAGLMQRMGAAWQAFMRPVNDPQAPWLQVVRGVGPEEVTRAYLDLVEGSTKPLEGHVLSL